MLDLQGKLVYHPRETRPNVITKKRHKCKLKDVALDTDGMHPLNTFGCRCRCSNRGCDRSGHREPNAIVTFSLTISMVFRLTVKEGPGTVTCLRASTLGYYL